MSVFRCKMCAGTLEIDTNQSTAVCDYCGTEQTLPRLDDDRRANLYDRANHFRRNNEFDKAASLYETILNEDSSDSEAYWLLVLCRYGIEYVEDPATKKRVPTVNRTQFTAIFDDDNYKSALLYADSRQKQIYKQQAEQINEIQKGILEISQKEEPFDVFICYKETDGHGKRTKDSVIANDLYYQLKAEGFKVFFSRITLEDKLGTAYEPYIFAALNSSKVMVVIGTRQEYFNAVWVKNEWSRFLSLVKQSGGKKMLIPAYKDMDPYDLPQEFAHLQAQDMSKLGFMQDLVRGIKKLTKSERSKAAEQTRTAFDTVGANVSPLLKRAFIFLEDGDWQSANEYCERVLDQDPECARAYLGKLLSDLYLNKQEMLRELAVPFADNPNYQKVMRFGDDELKETVALYLEHILIRNEQQRIKEIYDSIKSNMLRAKTQRAYKEIACKFESLGDYEDCASLAAQCYEKAEIARKDELIEKAKTKMHWSEFDEAVKILSSVSNWKNSKELIAVCEGQIVLKRKKQKLKIDAIISFLLLSILSICVYPFLKQVCNISFGNTDGFVVFLFDVLLGFFIFIIYQVALLLLKKNNEKAMKRK